MRKISSNDKLTIVEHLEELRYRIIISLIFLIIFSIIGYFYNEKILFLLTKPLGKKLVYLTPIEAFLVRIKISIFLGIFFSSPLILSQVTIFILPALKKEEKKLLLYLLTFGSILFFLGTTFGIFFLPLSIKILTLFSGEQLQPLFTAEKYIGFAFNLIFSCAIVFEFPILIIILVKFGIVSLKSLREKRKYIILGIFVIAAILTPGSDIFTQIILAVPLLLLFEISIYISNILMKNNQNR